MKFFTVFAAVVAIASASPSTWTLEKLDEAIQNPLTSATFKPVLLNALDSFMEYMYQGHEQVPMMIKTQAGPIGTFTLHKLGEAIERTEVDSIFKPYLIEALNEMMDSLFSGNPVQPVTVEVPALAISSWTLKELDDAVSSPDTNAELLPYLTEALDRFVEALFYGQQMNAILVAAPASLFDDVTPVVAEPIAVIPTPTEIPTSSPLVQVILNLQSNDAGVNSLLR